MIKSYKPMADALARQYIKELGLPVPAAQSGERLYKTCLWELENIAHKIVSKGRDPSIAYGSMKKLRERFLAVLMLDYYYIRAGRQTVQISDEAASVIENMNIEKVDHRSIKAPFRCSSWDLPYKLSQGRTIVHVYIENQEELDYISKKYTPSNVAAYTNRCTAFPTMLSASCVDFGAGSLHDLAFCISSVKEVWGNALHKEDLNHRDSPRQEQLDKASGFLAKVFVFLQAFPDALKEGPYVEVKITKKGKKGKLTTHTVKKRSLTVVLPEKIKTTKRAHFTQGHYRSLHHPRYARLDDNGNKLPVGEEGVVQVVYVTPHVRGGRVSHVSLDGENK